MTSVMKELNFKGSERKNGLNSKVALEISFETITIQDSAFAINE